MYKDVALGLGIVFYKCKKTDSQKSYGLSENMTDLLRQTVNKRRLMLTLSRSYQGGRAPR